MYTLVLSLHSWFRWIALIAGVAATVTTLADRSKTVGPGRSDMWGLILMMMLDIQLLLGLLLYLVVSPNMQAIRENFGAAMRDASLRFLAVEHVAMMLAAVTIVHVGRVLARRAPTADAKRMRMLLCFGFATVLMVFAIPWPGMASGRPLFRL